MMPIWQEMFEMHFSYTELPKQKDIIIGKICESVSFPRLILFSPL